jgi:hypothetical protein
MNVELMNRILAHAVNEPRRFNMETWYEDVSEAVKMDNNGYDFDEVIERANENSELFRDTNEIPPCGAVACVAGTACILSGKSKPYGIAEVINGRTVVSYTIPDGGWFEAGRRALDLTVEQAKRLFFPRKGFGLFEAECSEDAEDTGLYWCEPFATEYHMAETPVERTEVLKRRFAHFIATDGRE